MALQRTATMLMARNFLPSVFHGQRAMSIAGGRACNNFKMHAGSSNWFSSEVGTVSAAIAVPTTPVVCGISESNVNRTAQFGQHHSVRTQSMLGAPRFAMAQPLCSPMLMGMSASARISPCMANSMAKMQPATQEQIRTQTYGREYQPSNRRRKRRFGFLKRLRDRGGRAVLKRRRFKKRSKLAH